MREMRGRQMEETEMERSEGEGGDRGEECASPVLKNFRPPCSDTMSPTPTTDAKHYTDIYTLVKVGRH